MQPEIRLLWFALRVKQEEWDRNGLWVGQHRRMLTTTDTSKIETTLLGLPVIHWVHEDLE